jgi:hypothetical protein
MAISGNPLHLAREIGDGFQSLTPASLKKYTPADLKVISNSLQQVLRDTRGEAMPAGDAEATRKKSHRMQRLNQAIIMLTNYCRQHRIPL